MRLNIELVRTARVPPGRTVDKRPAVNCVVVSQDGRCAATGHGDGLIRIWDVKTGTLTWTFEAHQWGEVFIALSTDAALALSACADGSICFWDLKTGTLVRQFSAAGQRRLSMVALTTDLTLAATNRNSNSEDFRDGIVLWDVATGRQLRELQTDEPGGFSAALSPTADFAAAGTQKGRVLLWDLRHSDAREAFSAHPDAQPYGAAVTFSADGRYLGTYAKAGWGSGREYDKVMKVWHVESRTCVASLSGHLDGITSLSLNADGAVALSTALDKTIYIWDAMSGQRVGEIAGDVEAPSVGLSGAADWIVGGSFIDDRLRFWKLTWS